MQNAAGGGASAPSDGRNDGHQAVVSDLVSLIERVQASMKLIDTAIAGEAPLGNQEIAANVVVLDDITPRYLKARAALSACEAGLGIALHFLRDTRTSKHRTDKAGGGRHPVRSIGRA